MIEDPTLASCFEGRPSAGLILKEKRKLQVLQNAVLRIIFASEDIKISEQLRRKHSKKCRDLCRLNNVFGHV